MRQVSRLGARDYKQAPVFLVATLLALLVGTALVLSPLVALLVGCGLGLVLLFALVPRSSFFSDVRLPSLGYNRLLFWLMLINTPIFMEFDPTGRTKDLGLLNMQSLSRIAVVGAVAFLFFAGRAVSSSVQFASAPKQSLFPVFRLPLLLYGYYTVHALFVLRGTELYLALYRIAEWALFFLLVTVIFSEGRKLDKDNSDEMIKTILPIVFFPIAAIIVAGIIAPGQVYGVSEATGVARLGGLWAHPNVLGLFATLGIFYVLSYWKKYKWLAIAALSAILLLSYSRGSLMGLLLTIPVYLFLQIRSASSRVFLLVGAGLAVTVAAVMFADELHDSVTNYMMRGQADISQLTTLSERTIVWEAARQMIEEKPLVGYGFVAGPKHVADIVALMPTGQWFLPLHAHNELLQAQISGGILATLLVLAIVMRMIYLLFRLSNRIER
ncbi:MAG TPA: O-antigen ligase family protein, partial [Pyrinomonadaceae bacterium]|nr:O-antigen ligase family protein [Pyrinomonadaceae bacterium]